MNSSLGESLFDVIFVCWYMPTLPLQPSICFIYLGKFYMALQDELPLGIPSVS